MLGISSRQADAAACRQKGVRASWIVATATAVLWSASAWSALTTGCPDHIYLGNNPSNTEAPDWSNNAQGVANDGEHWFFTRVNRLFKYEADWTPVDGDDIGKIASVGFPAELSAKSINHFGDPDHYRGYIFMPFEGSESVKAVIAVFRASDLAFVDWVDVTAHQVKAGWLAIDPVASTLYTSIDHLVAGTPLLRYQVDVTKIENEIQGDFLTPTTSAAVQDSDGTPVSADA